jgi:threonine/homoserine/homoserine lactone efflux protein
MLALSTWLVFVAASVALAATPGPNLVYLVSRTLVQGRAAGFVSLGGTLTGLAVHVLAAALGLSALLVAVPMAYDVVRFAGALYLAWLAWQTWRSADANVESATAAPASRWRLWRDGVALAQSLVLGATQIVVVMAFDGVCVLAASAMRARLATKAWSRWSRRVLAGIFAALAARLILDRR